MIRNFYCSMGVLLFLLVAATSATAQQTVYKWTDEHGVVHFSEDPPEGVTSEKIVTEAPPRSPPPIPASTPVRATEDSGVRPSDVAQESPPPVVAVTPVLEMSLADLDNRCEDAREAKIAPLRTAEIERCKKQPRSDPEFCESHNADFGDGGRTMSGAMRPRMFDDIPECVEALQERNRRQN